MMYSTVFIILLDSLSAHDSNGKAPLARKGKKQGQVSNVFRENLPWENIPKMQTMTFMANLRCVVVCFVGYCIDFHFVYCHTMKPYASSF